MFKKIFVEKSISQHPQTKKILNKLNNKNVQIIDSYQDYFEKVKKPYLQKRNNLNLFLAKKKGKLVKETPNAYGLSGEKHFYFIHAYNCIYECDYCYLQGYFNSPDIIMFVNHDDIIKEMQKITDKSEDGLWFHAGEFSDSLALSHISQEMDQYLEFLRNNKKAKLEIRTKSVNTKALTTPLDNLYISFSLSPEWAIKEHDLKTPPLTTRLKAINKLYEKGFKIGIHLDPIIYEENFKDNYANFLKELNQHIPINRIEYISIGVVRFTSDVWREVKNNYPQSSIHQQELIKGENGLIRYNKPMRNWIMNTVKEEVLNYKIEPKKVYLCMEDLSL
jgi:spore photoproduct lyase